MMTNGTFSSMVSSLFGYVDGLGFKSQLWVCEFVLYKKILSFLSHLYIIDQIGREQYYRISIMDIDSIFSNIYFFILYLRKHPIVTIGKIEYIFRILSSYYSRMI